MVNMPKLKMPSNPVKIREEDGVKIVGGQSLQEWIVSVGVLIILWCIMGAIFTGFLAIATSVRDARSPFPRPANGCLPCEAGCERTFSYVKNFACNNIQQSAASL